MENNQYAAPKGGIFILKARGDVNVRGWDKDTFEVQANPASIKIIAEENTTRLTSLDDCALKVPQHYQVLIEKVSGDAWLEDLLGEIQINSVGGDISVIRLANIQIEKVGGDCMLEEIAAPLNCLKVGGDLTGNALAGGLIDSSVGGDVRLLEVFGGVRLRAGGDIDLAMAESGGEEIILKAGGDVHVSVPRRTGWKLDLTSGGNDIRLEIENNLERIDDWALLRTIGDGKTNLRATAGGDIHVSDEPFSTENGERKAQKSKDHWFNLEKTVPGFALTIDGVSFSQELSERIAQKTEAAVRKAENKIKDFMQRMDDHKGETIVESTRFFRDEQPIPSTEGHVNTETAYSPVSEEERLVVLRMLQDKKLTVEEADRLLDALEYSAQE